MPVRRLGWRGSSRYPIAPAVLRHLRDADLVHVHGIDFFFDYLALTRRLHRKPLVVSTHGGFFHTSALRRLKQAYFRVVTRRSLRAYAAVIACSDHDAAMFLPISDHRLVTIENGADLRKFADCGARTPERCLIYFGRLAVHKRIEDLFVLLAALHRRSADWRLIVAGSPGDLDWHALAMAASRQAVASSVEYLAAPDDQELRAALGRASYYVSASAHEGFGIAAVEGLSAGLVPVLSDIPPFRKLLAKVGFGTPIDTADPEGTAERLEQLHADLAYQAPAIRQRLIRTAAEYDWAAVARRYASLYRRFAPMPGIPA